MGYYNELVKALREASEMPSLSLYKRGLMKQAAKIIESLIAENEDRARNIEMLQKADVRPAGWTFFNARPMTQDERNEWGERLGYNFEDDENAVMYEGPLPDDGQKVLVCNKWGTIWVDTFENDPDYGCTLEDEGDLDGVIAWMPLPEPPKEE